MACHLSIIEAWQAIKKSSGGLLEFKLTIYICGWSTKHSITRLQTKENLEVQQITDHVIKSSEMWLLHNRVHRGQISCCICTWNNWARTRQTNEKTHETNKWRKKKKKTCGIWTTLIKYHYINNLVSVSAKRENGKITVNSLAEIHRCVIMFLLYSP